MNPFVIEENEIHLLDLVAKLDDTARFMMKEQWGAITFPTGFGQDALSPKKMTVK